MGLAESTLATLDARRQRADACMVAFSGGKDSLVVMDLCMRTFSRVQAFFMYLVPGLECVEIELEKARARWGIEIRQYPHWLVHRLIKNGVYCNSHWTNEALPEWKLAEVYALALLDSEMPQLATGAKKADSGWRRRFMSTDREDQVFYPIAQWHKYDVLAYLKARQIALPPSSGHSATGIDLSAKSLLWLNDTFPDDFKRLCEVFPFAEAVVWRRAFYGPE